MNTSQKSFLSIRSKLLAAVAMLLVASFMVVSSTYAWFTLSTAPEVTGITTQVGANGNLEIALNTTNTLPGNATGLTNVVDKNATWGNIIDLGNVAYGLNSIILKPSRLAVTEDGKMAESPLYTPIYGSDGRIDSIANNGFYGTWNGTGFAQQTSKNEGYGVRALGTVSSMSNQQLQFATSSSEVKTSLEMAANNANSSLKDNGGALVTLLLKGATATDAAPATFDVTAGELEPLQTMINTLNAIPARLQNAAKNYMLILLAKANENKTDNEFNAIVSAFDANWSDIFTQLQNPDVQTITVTVGEGESLATYNVEAPANLKAVAQAYVSVTAQVAAAQGKYNDAKTAGTTDWEGLKAILSPLMNVDQVDINGKTVAEIQAQKDTIYSWAWGVAQEGVKVGMKKGSGVYATIASVTKNLNANFTADINVSVNGTPMEMDNMKINMYTSLDDTVTPESPEVDITTLVIASEMRPANRTGVDANAVISDTYGYVLDFVFRTNAAGSTLKLQQDATDRIYTDNTNANAETMGGGSYMEFSTQAGFGDDSVKNLMDNIKLVFVDTKTGELLVGAYLDTATAESDGSTVKAAVKLQAVSTDNKELVGYEQKLDENDLPMFEEDGKTPIYDETKPIYNTLDTYRIVWGEKFDDNEQNIVDLGQNEATYISVYVYLDGDSVGNADVAALSNLSTSGNLNLQFSSSAALKPMEYSGLQNPTT